MICLFQIQSNLWVWCVHPCCSLVCEGTKLPKYFSTAVTGTDTEVNPKQPTKFYCDICKREGRMVRCCWNVGRGNPPAHFWQPAGHQSREREIPIQLSNNVFNWNVSSAFNPTPLNQRGAGCLNQHPRLRCPGNSGLTALLRDRTTYFYLVSSEIQSSNLPVTDPTLKPLVYLPPEEALTTSLPATWGSSNH